MAVSARAESRSTPVSASAKVAAKAATSSLASASSRARASTPRPLHTAVAPTRTPRASPPSTKPLVMAKTASPKPLLARPSTPASFALASAPKPLASAPQAQPAPSAAAAPAPSPAPSVSLASVIPPPTAAPAPSNDEPSGPRFSDDFSERSNELLADHIPRIAQHAERMVLRVLHVAAQADVNGRSGDIRQASRMMRVPTDDALFGIRIAPNEARRLNDAASAAFWNERNLRRALSLQARAFGANPLDREIAGNYAFYLLKQRPAQAETARQLALHALTVSDPQLPGSRADDWTTFAIASALAGRQRDASHALFVTLALSESLDRPCRAALAAYASHGERLRQPTEEMLYRIRSWGRSEESSFCRWPPSWAISARAQ